VDKNRWLWIAVLWHAIADGGAVYLVTAVNPYAAELWIGAVCLASLVIIYLLSDFKVNKTGAVPAGIQEGIPHDLPNSVEVTDEHIERTRYTTDFSD
jgi:hypothetical protein